MKIFIKRTEQLLHACAKSATSKVIIAWGEARQILQELLREQSTYQDGGCRFRILYLDDPTVLAARAQSLPQAVIHLDILKACFKQHLPIVSPDFRLLYELTAHHTKPDEITKAQASFDSRRNKARTQQSSSKPLSLKL